MSLKQKQLASIKFLLKNRNRLDGSKEVEPLWKVLIVDRIGNDIISPILNKSDLRAEGVTLYLYLHSDRDQIPKVPAYYFCTASDENLERIGQDMQKELYETFHLNFLTQTSRRKLEYLADVALQANCFSNIHSLYDQYTNFICLEEDFFILRSQDSEPISYFSINRPFLEETEMDNILETISFGLFSVFVTLGCVPIIKCLKNSSSEVVAKKLEKQFRQELWDSKNNLFHKKLGQYSSNFQRVLLIICDRNDDIVTPLRHPWTYQPLVHEVLNLSMNVVYFPSSDNNNDKVAFSLNSKDEFWEKHKSSSFPDVATAIQEELNMYKKAESDLKTLKSSVGSSGSTGVANLINIHDGTETLTNAVNVLPNLLEKKKLIDIHTKIATYVLEFIKKRHMDMFFEIEEKITSKVAIDRSISEILREKDKGTADDKMRLFLIYYIYNNVNEDDLEAYKTYLVESGCDLSPLIFIQRWKSMTRLKKNERFDQGDSKPSNMLSKIVSQGSSIVVEGVKNLVLKRNMLPITKLTESLMDNQNKTEKDDFLYIDPELLKANENTETTKPSFNEAVVFVIGGGNYFEYQNLMEFAKQKSVNLQGKKIIYGSTSLESPIQFLNQLNKLGKKLESSQ